LYVKKIPEALSRRKVTGINLHTRPYLVSKLRIRGAICPPAYALMVCRRKTYLWLWQWKEWNRRGRAAERRVQQEMK